MNSTSSVVKNFSNTHGAFTEAHVTCAMCMNTLHFSKVVNLYFWRPIWFPTIHPSIHPSSECWTQFQLTGREAGYTLDIIVLTKRQGEPFMLTFTSMASLESSNKLACLHLHPVTCRKPWDRFKLTILLQGKYHASLLSRDALFPWSP